MVPKINEIFDFQKHDHGPYSQTLQKVIEDPLHLGNPYVIRRDGTVSINQSGKDYFNKIIDQYKDNERFVKLLQALKLTQNPYDKLGRDAILFLTCVMYLDCVDASNICDKLVNNKKNEIDYHTHCSLGDY